MLKRFWLRFLFTIGMYDPRHEAEAYVPLPDGRPIPARFGALAFPHRERRDQIIVRLDAIFMPDRRARITVFDHRGASIIHDLYVEDSICLTLNMTAVVTPEVTIGD